MKLLVVQLKSILCQTKPVCLQRTIRTGNFFVELSGSIIGHEVIGSILIWAKGWTVGSWKHRGVAHTNWGNIMEHSILSTGNTVGHELLHHFLTSD